jgi:hypothetical protein
VPPRSRAGGPAAPPAQGVSMDRLVSEGDAYIAPNFPRLDRVLDVFLQVP